MNTKSFNNLFVTLTGWAGACCKAASVIIALVIVTIFSLGFYIYHNFLDERSLKEKIENTFYADTGKKLNIKDVKLFYSMFPKLRLKNIEIIDAKKGGAIANIENCEIKGDILSLFDQKAIFNIQIHNAYPKWKNKRLFFPNAEILLRFDYGKGQNIVSSADGNADFVANIGKSNIAGKILLNNGRLKVNATSDVVDWRDFRLLDDEFNMPLLIDVTVSADIIKSKIFNMSGNDTDNADVLSDNKTDKLFINKPLKDYFHKGYESVFDIKIKHAVYPDANNVNWDNILINYVNDGKSENLHAESFSSDKKFNINVRTDYQIVEFDSNVSLNAFSYKSDNYQIKKANVLFAASGKTGGDTVAELAENVSGHLFYNVNDAEILTKIPDMGKTLASLIKKETYKSTRFSCMAVDADFINGRADIANRAALESDDFNSVFDGYVDLGSKRLDVGVLSLAKNALSDNKEDVSLSRLTGPFSNLEIKSDQSVSDFLKFVGDKENGLVSFISGNILSINEKHPCQKIVDDRNRKKINVGKENLPRLRRR